MDDDQMAERRGNYEIYQKVWPEAKALRSSGALLQALQKVTCPITALHGEWDPHPIDGAFDSLTPLYSGIVLKECGHTPWIERRARDQFFDLLQKELQS
jgi:pimeloyl-ACP methyl ester carboxylesterase